MVLGVLEADMSARTKLGVYGQWLSVQEATTTAKTKLGRQNQWLKIKNQQGNGGYVAAWLVSETP